MPTTSTCSQPIREVSMNKKSLRIGGALFGAAALATGGVTAAATAASPRSRPDQKSGPTWGHDHRRSWSTAEHGFRRVHQPIAQRAVRCLLVSGRLGTNGAGKAHGVFVGRFSIETFTVAPGSGPPPLCTMDRSPTRRRTRNSLRCTSITSGCGSTRPRTRPRSPVPTSSRRSTGSTMRARRR
jgi:hypothetical protein